jgi:putative hydrolase of the HAD superfamily
MKRNARIRLLVFDLDDTLIDTSRVFFEARDAFISFMMSKGHPEESTLRAFGEAEERNLARYGYISERNLVTMREAYEELSQQDHTRIVYSDLERIGRIGLKCLYTLPKALPGAVELIKWCRGRYRLALLTRGSIALQTAKINSLGIRDAFETIHIVSRKTPASFYEVFSLANCRPENSVSIGDSMRFDILPAIEIGMAAAIHTQYPFSDMQWDHDKCTEVGPCIFTATGLAEVTQILLDLEAAAA